MSSCIVFSCTEDAGLDNDELYILLKTGGRNRSTLKRRTKYRPLMEKLDTDQSKALSQSELWTPIKNVIELEGKSCKLSDITRYSKYSIPNVFRVFDTLSNLEVKADKN